MALSTWTSAANQKAFSEGKAVPMLMKEMSELARSFPKVVSW